MSFHTLLGAFPIARSGNSLEPRPGARVGDLRTSSRGGALFGAVGDILNAVPGYDVLRFISREQGPLPERRSDAETRWTLIDPATALDVIAALDGVLAACDQRADAVAALVSFGADRLEPTELRRALLAARQSWESGGAAAEESDGDSAEHVFFVLVGLRELLRRACAENERIAVFTWAPP